MTDFEMDKMYKITGRELLALLSLIPDGTEKAKAIVDNVAEREKSGKVNESQIDFSYRASSTTSYPSFWESTTPGKTWVIGPDTGKGVDMKKINEELWKELEEYEKREKE